MKTTEVNNSIIGKRCECMFTGMLVTGTIVDIVENQHTADVKVKYDQPHQWGNDIYTEGWSWGRKCDEFGSLHHLSVIPFDTISVVFANPIPFRKWSVCSKIRQIGEFPRSAVG